MLTGSDLSPAALDQIHCGGDIQRHHLLSRLTHVPSANMCTIHTQNIPQTCAQTNRLIKYLSMPALGGATVAFDFRQARYIAKCAPPMPGEMMCAVCTLDLQRRSFTVTFVPRETSKRPGRCCAQSSHWTCMITQVQLHWCSCCATARLTPFPCRQSPSMITDDAAGW